MAKKLAQLHKECIIAWANGEEIEVYDQVTNVWKITHKPKWNISNRYKVKKRKIVHKAEEFY